MCKFTIKCPTCKADINYTENILRDVLVRGLADSEVQLDLLGDKNQDMALEEFFHFIEAKEAGKPSAQRTFRYPRGQCSQKSISPWQAGGTETVQGYKQQRAVHLLRQTRPRQECPTQGHEN